MLTTHTTCVLILVVAMKQTANMKSIFPISQQPRGTVCTLALVLGAGAEIEVEITTVYVKLLLYVAANLAILRLVR